MVSEGEAVFGHIGHEEWRQELVLLLCSRPCGSKVGVSDCRMYQCAEAACKEFARGLLNAVVTVVYFHHPK